MQQVGKLISGVVSTLMVAGAFAVGSGVAVPQAASASPLLPYLSWTTDGVCGSSPAFAGGTGTSSDPYQVSTALELQELADCTADMTTVVATPSRYFIQTTDIDLDGYTFDPIGGRESNVGLGVNCSSNWCTFRSSYDGNNHAISNLTVAGPTTLSYSQWTGVGLFGWISSPAVIKNLDLVDPDVQAPGEEFVGALVGRSQGGVIEEVAVRNPTVIGGGRVGGLAGEIADRYSGPTAIGSLTKSCVDGGSVKTVGTSGTILGGAGGLVGRISRPVSESFTTANVFSEDPGRDAAGFADEIAVAAVTDSYAAGTVTHSGYGAGFVGVLQSAGTTNRTFAVTPFTGTFAGISESFGWVVNDQTSSPASVTNFWDLTVSGVTVEKGPISSSSGGVATGQTTAWMKTASNLTSAGYSSSVWNLVDGSYPTLKAFPNGCTFASTPSTYSVTYNGNGATSGSAPTDGTAYAAGASATVAGNTGTLARTNYTFNGWNTAANGSGTSYVAGDSLTMSAATTLYAKWLGDPTSMAYDANGATSGTVPVDIARPYGSTVTALGKGTLRKTGKTFRGWNTAANGSGTAVTAGATFTMTSGLTLFAQWGDPLTCSDVQAYPSPQDSNVCFWMEGLASLPPPLTVPAGISSVDFVVVGGGGGGGGATASKSGSGGGGGSVVVATGVSVVAGESIASVVGAAGTGGAGGAAAAAGTSGGASTLTIGGSSWTAAGGTGGDSGASTAQYPGGNSSQTINGATTTWTGGEKTGDGGAGGAGAGANGGVGWFAEGGGGALSYTATDGLFAVATSFAGPFGPGGGGGAGAAAVSSPLYGTGGLGGGGRGVAVAVTPESSSVADACCTLGAAGGGGAKPYPTFPVTAATGGGAGTPGGYVILFDLVRFTATYDSNGGTSGTLPSDEIDVARNATVTVAGNTGTLTRTNYTFDGWNTAADGSGTAYVAGDTFTISADTTLYAQWLGDPTAVTYDANGATSGSAPIDSSSPYAYGSTVTVLSGSGLSKTAAIFDGWNTAANGSGTDYAENDTFTLSGATTMYAQWVYEVTYDGNGSVSGSVPVDASSPYVLSSTVTVVGNTGSLVNGTRRFLGWNTAANGSGTGYSSGDTFTLSTGVTLYAQWSAPYYSVDYQGNGSTAGLVPTDNSSPYIENSTVTVAGVGLGSGALRRYNYSFTGWNTQPGGGGTAYQPGDTFSAALNTTLFAQWQILPDYTMTYDSNGATGGTAPVDAGSPYYADEYATVMSEGSLVKNHYTFAGWNTAANGTGASYNAGASLLLTQNTTLYAQWTVLPQHTIGYNSNGATAGQTPVDVGSPYYLGDSVLVLGPGALSRAHYSFAGWNTAANGSGSTYSQGTTFQIAANLVLYAQWTSLPQYAVTYNGNGKSGGSVPVDASSPYFSDDTITVLGAGTMKKAGFSFAGWNDVANGTGTAFAVGSAFVPTVDVTLYAQWVALPDYLITYDANGAASGSAPTDVANPYYEGKRVEVLGNSGAMALAGYHFDGWNTRRDGRGTSYVEGETFNISGDTTLFAVWTRNGLPPDTPAAPTVVASDGQVVITGVRAPSGTTPARFIVTASNGATCSFASTTGGRCTIRGLINGRTYTFTVVARNEYGDSTPSAPSLGAVPLETPLEPVVQPMPAPIPPGDSALLVNGRPDNSVVVEPNSEETGLEISGNGFTMSLDGLDGLGNPLNLDANGVLLLQENRSVQTSGTGFRANSDVELYINPPTSRSARVSHATRAKVIYVGTLRTNASGSFSGVTQLPMSVTAGVHMLQAVGVTPGNQRRAMTLGVKVKADVVAPGVVTRPSIVVTADGVAHLRWGAPKTGARVTSYEVTYRLTAEPRFGAPVVVNRTNTKIPGFVGGCAYFVRIVALNGGGRGPALTKLLVVGVDGKSTRGDFICPVLRR